MSEVIGVKEQSINQISYIFTSEKYSVGDMLLISNGKGEYVYECVRESEDYNKYAHKIMPALSVRQVKSEELLNYICNQSEKDQFKQVFKDMLKVLEVNALLIDIEFSLDNEHLKYTYFSSEKLHFPKMIKYLLSHNPRRVKIEFFQVGEREYYAINGGIGVCGYELCCHSRSYNTPTITTNSLQTLGINVSLKKTLTGTCGKYKCCTLFNIEDKEELKKNLPDLDTEFTYLKEKVVVTQIDFECETVTVIGKEVLKIDFEYFMKGNDASN